MPTDTFTLTKAAAEKYQANSVPAMFEPLARATLDKISLPDGADVIDIACGTGALTRVIAERMGGVGRISGTDLNETMIDVAKAQMPDTPHQVDWSAADVSDLPYEDDSFDVGFIQQGLQFFPDKPKALSEVHRVLKPGGSLYLTCWRAVSPFNGALSEALADLVGTESATKAAAPFSFRDGDLIAALLTDAGFRTSAAEGVVLQRRFDDIRAQILALPIEADLRAAGPDITDQVVAETARRLAPFEKSGVFVVPQEAHLFHAIAR